MLSNFLTTTFNQISANRLFNRRAATNTGVRVQPPQAPRLLCVLAHPDDEALCVGGTLAKYAVQGVEIALVVATRGERGWRGPVPDDPGPRRMGQVREAELRESARWLGVREIQFLDYVDGQLASEPFDEIVSAIAREIRRFRPDVVITFDAHGMYGHPDHVAVSQATTAALVAALDPTYTGAAKFKPHRVQKLYHRVFSERALGVYQEVFGELKMQLGQGMRTAVPWQDWAITTRVDVSAHQETIWNAIAAHRSQLAPNACLRTKFRAAFAEELNTECFYRAFSTTNTANTAETDLFEGARVKEKNVETLRSNVLMEFTP